MSDTNPRTLAAAALAESLAVHRAIVEGPLVDAIVAAADLMVRALRAGGTVYWVGNGGSAADAQHLAAELVGRFHHDRPPLRSHALTVNTSALTALVNDYPPEQVFERQARAFCGPNDVLVGISTSGNSANVVLAMEAARANGCATAAFTGQGGGRLAEVADVVLRSPSRSTPRIQEGHILIGHTVCELVEAAIHPKGA
jgi:D-sedoheptulose 7-phosphate isomerase